MSYKISFCELQHLILWGYNVSKHTWVSVFFMFIFWTSGFALWAAEMRWPTTVLNKHRYKILEANIGWHLLQWVTLKIHFMIGSLQFQFHFHWNFKAYFSLTGIQDKGTSLTFSSCAHSPHMHYHTINKQLISWKGKKNDSSLEPPGETIAPCSLGWQRSLWAPPTFGNVEQWLELA